MQWVWLSALQKCRSRDGFGRDGPHKDGLGRDGPHKDGLGRDGLSQGTALR